MANYYQQYLQALNKPFKKISKLEFLQPDNSVAFTLDNNFKRGYRSKYDTRAFIQSGTLSVSLQNGQRRKASVLLSNLDGAFDYNVNKIWFGQRVRLSMGLVLPDGTDYYLPQGVFYISNPSAVFSPNQRTTTLNLVDKWSYLDGSLFGSLDNSYKIERTSDVPENNIWSAMTSLLRKSKIDFERTEDKNLQIDNVNPVFTNYYDDKTYLGASSQNVLNISDRTATITNGTEYVLATTYELQADTTYRFSFNYKINSLSPVGTVIKCQIGYGNTTFNYAIGAAESYPDQTLSTTTPFVINFTTPSSFTGTHNLIVKIVSLSQTGNCEINLTKIALYPYILYNMTDIAYEILVSGDNATLAQVMLELNGIIVGWIGYDQTGALRVEPSQDDLEDNQKPVLWNFTPENSSLCSLSETYKNTEVYNDIIIIGQSQSNTDIYGRASNFDEKSDTNINLIGRRTYRESQPNYWNIKQCEDLAKFRLKRKTVLQKNITIESPQLFHLIENNVVTVKRTDKSGSPIERHLIQSFSLPIGETGSMSINCVSVNDLPEITQSNT